MLDRVSHRDALAHSNQTSPSLPDKLGERLAADAVESGLAGPWSVETSRGFLIEGEISRQQLERVAIDVLVDPVVEVYTIGPSNAPMNGPGTVVHVMPKPGVTDPEGSSALDLLRDLGYPVSNVRTIRTYRVHGPAESIPRLIERVLANDAVELDVPGYAHPGSPRHRPDLSISARLGSDS